MVSLVYSTTSSESEAKEIAEHLVKKRLVACVNIIPKVISIYRWKDKIENDSESILLAKTKDKNVEAVVKAIKILHSYEVPDIISIPISSGLDRYLNYVKSETL